MGPFAHIAIFVVGKVLMGTWTSYGYDMVCIFVIRLYGMVMMWQNESFRASFQGGSHVDLQVYKVKVCPCV